jgi:glutamyl/glutaminyl-tRNA synthetase
MKKIVLVIVIIVSIIFVSAFYKYGRTIWVPIYLKIVGKRTVQDIINKIGSKVENSLRQDFKKINAYYPPANVIIISYKAEKILELWIKESNKYIKLKDYKILAASGKSGSKFNYHKLLWFNEHYIHNMDLEKLIAMLEPHIQQTEYADAPPDKLKQAVSIVQSSLHNFEEIKEKLYVFFSDDLKIDDPGINKVIKNDDSQKIFKKFIEISSKQDSDLDFPKIMETIQKETGVKGAKLWKPFRYALTMTEHGPDIGKMIEFFGKQKVIQRIEYYIDS